MRKQNLFFSSYSFLQMLFAQKTSLKVVNTFHIKSGGGWDYIFVDTASNKLFVSHGTQVNVLIKILVIQ